MSKAFDRIINSGNPAAISALARGDLRNALVAATPGGIEAQEAEGQRDLVTSSNRIPKDGSEEVAKALGIRLLSDADDLFIYAKLPHGWKIKPTDHSMWSEVVDAEGTRRAAIFYKAAFYDRKAFITLETGK